jgi:hypothetical protein
MSRKNYRTDLLFPKTGFLVGMGSVIGIGGNYFEFNYSQTDEEADSKAIESDWAMIGQDIYHTLDESPITTLQIA